ncbi:MAG: hypothetical protein NTX00_02515 [Candidatus Parcubacteria bacterium]|nr:hypothetical protein [Candidatus Parcubacteria bacterium]
MSRIEEKNNQNQVEELESEIEKLKKNLKRKQNRKFWNCGTCLLFFILILFFLAVAFAYFLALSGLVNVPYFTEHFYHEPQPSYLINTENITANEKNLTGLIEKAASQEVLKQKKTENIKITLELNEAQITAMLRDQIKSNQMFNNKIEYLQVAVLQDNLELFAKFKEPKLFVTLKILPQIKNNNLNFKVIEFRIGNLKLPSFLGSLGLTYLLEKSLNQLLNSLANLFLLDNIELAAKTAKVQLLIKSLKF